MSGKEDIDFARFKELDSLLRWMETEKQEGRYRGIKYELLRRMTRLNEEHLGFWRKI